MNNLSLLRVMVIKEVRTTFRERSQMMGITISLLAMMLALGSTFFQLRARPAYYYPATQRTASSAPSFTQAAPPPRAKSTQPQLWMAIALAAFLGFFFSMGYLISAVLASFVGEKEARTLEILLASPLSDAKLFIMKSIGALLPSTTIGFFFAIIAATLYGTVAPPMMGNLSAGQLIFAVIFGLPLLILLQLSFVGIGAAISIKSETMKGAGQMFGVVFLVLFFGIGYGTPLLWAIFPQIRPPLLGMLDSWMRLHFVIQYGVSLLIFALPAALFMSIARTFFRRDRMLS